MRAASKPDLVAIQNLDLLLLLRIADHDLEQEAVELGLGQGIGAFVFDRILRGEGGEDGAQRMDLAVDADLPLLHRLQQGRLRLGRGAVDLVGQQQVAEDGPRGRIGRRAIAD